MAKYIALIRGINVNGSNLIRMDALKESMVSIGLISVRTYIQSGNLVFEYQEMPNAELEKLIGSTIFRDFGLNVPVLVKTSVELEKAIAENPFMLERKTTIDTLHITFLAGIPEKGMLNNLLPMKDGVDEGLIKDDRIYLNCPQGYGRTKFTNTFLEKKLKVKATTRNWKTLLKLKEMTGTDSFT